MQNGSLFLPPSLKPFGFIRGGKANSKAFPTVNLLDNVLNSESLGRRSHSLCFTIFYTFN